MVKKKKDIVVEKIKSSRNSNDKYKQGLKKSRESFAFKFKKLLARHREIDENYFNDLEETLIISDVGVNYVDDLIKRLKEETKIKKLKDPKDINNLVFKYLFDNYYKKSKNSSKEDEKSREELKIEKNKLNVILVIGVNGVGKTTSISKLGYYFLKQKYKVALVAADTFRAGAVAQLEAWAKKINVNITIPNREGQDPASVVYKALEKANNDQTEILIIDTAGRLQNKKNLMMELDKINKIIERKNGRKANEILLVLDATTGQNGIHQAAGFNEVIDLSGIILTKMDSSAKGGIILSINDYFNLPVKFIGLGEKIEDLEKFNLEKYLENLTGEKFTNSEHKTK